MTSHEFLTIGSFALLTGLSIPALRHYDETGVLRPAHVDDRTSYRYYQPDQVRTGRMIRALRAIDLPIEEIRQVLEAGDEESVKSVLVGHQNRLTERAEDLKEMVESLDRYIEKGVVMAEVRGSRIAMVNIGVKDLEPARRFYEETFGVEFAEERHEGGVTHLNASFGTWPSDSFFLIQLWPGSDRAGTADVGFLVEDLDAAYERALAAGGTDVHGPKDIEGMPRVAQVKDPAGNDIGLYHG